MSSIKNIRIIKDIQGGKSTRFNIIYLILKSRTRTRKFYKLFTSVNNLPLLVAHNVQPTGRICLRRIYIFKNEKL